ncbi:hypothetical protein CDL12_10506 [Handroanthus impetiginosus]|uniref:Uncharacterized protein n=1 Tax=Handroanthus impetiginosus TaxID=429701 RepID=A0A2G9HH49_9LAMI|nr:hypothetical protein CDL12_10506 [Handroanthus impetiginosus]
MEPYHDFIWNCRGPHQIHWSITECKNILTPSWYQNPTSASFAVGLLMASKLNQLRTKAVEVSNLVAKNGGAYYKELMERNKQYIQDPPTVEKCQFLGKQLFYTSLASIPGRYALLWKELDYLKHLLKHRHEVKIEYAGIGALFGLECYAWYCVGEIVGRGFTITGYYV